MKRGKVAVGYVHSTDVSIYFHTSLLNTFVADMNGARRIMDGGARIPKYSSANISNARNAIVRTFLTSTDAEWLWMVDTDMAWEPDALDILLAHASRERAPIVGGLCFGVEDGQLFPTLYAWEKRGEGLGIARYSEFPDDAMFQVGATGAAFLLIHRSVLEAVESKGFNKTFPWFQETEMNGLACGEDITFCARAGMCGFPVYVHTGVEVGHHKSYTLTAAMYRDQRSHKEA
jgi:GT2 family glycosyltransferase